MDLTTDLRAACAAVRNLFAAAACSCALVTDDGGALEYVAADGAGANAITGVRLPVDRGIAGFVALSGQPVAISDVAQDRRFARDVAEATAYVPTAILAVPLFDEHGETIGVLSLLDPTRPDGGAGLDTLAVIASQVAVTVRLWTRAAAAALVLADRGLVEALAALQAAGAERQRVAREVLTAIASLPESR